MQSLIGLVQAHPTTFALVGYYVVSAAISSLPAPSAESHQFYRWFFQFSNTLAGNLNRAFSSKLPGGTNAPPAGK